ncbi:MAG: FAD-dependent oxidoreductase [Verrucomicrobia bacterium]|nr:FAD-dependent oxidoreductase [Verrucomicrobiota bacterium]
MLRQISARCLKCKIPRCSSHCPVSTPIPDVMRLFEENKEREAAEILFANNPLSAICSVVCPHERNCCGHCVLGKKADPVEFYKIEQHLSRQFLAEYEPPAIKKKNIHIAVIGSGPAGITMSILLSLKGFHVTLMEARDKIGGVLRYGIPEFRLPKNLVAKYETILFKLGVRFKPNTFIGSSITLDEMFIDGYKAVFIAVGTAKPNKLGLLGETLGHVFYAIDYLKTPEAYHLGKHVVVVGAGNVALDVARVAVRHIEKDGTVTIVNSLLEEDMTAHKREVTDAVKEGIKFVHLLQAVKLDHDGVKCVAVKAEKTEKGIVYEEDFKRVRKIPADSIILAIGQGPQGAVMADSNVSKTHRGLVDADENGYTSSKGVFAAGDIVTGPKTVVEAVAFTKKVASEIEKYCLEN